MNKEKLLFEISVRSGGFVCWYSEDSLISTGNDSGNKYIEVDTEDFLIALDIAREHPNDWIRVYPKGKKEDVGIPENMEIKDSK